MWINKRLNRCAVLLVSDSGKQVTQLRYKNVFNQTVNVLLCVRVSLSTLYMVSVRPSVRLKGLISEKTPRSEYVHSLVPN